MDRKFSKHPMYLTSIRMPRRDIEVIYEGARIEGLSRSEFLRQASLDRARRIIRRAAREAVSNAEKPQQ